MIIEPYAWKQVKITDITPVSSDTLSLRLERPVHYSFTEGQYTVVRVTPPNGQLVVRQYSFSSAPHENYLEMTIQKEKGGEVSTWLEKFAATSTFIEISQPFGSFLQLPPGREIVFIGGRVGIAPFMSVLRAQKETSHFHILYSVRQDDQVCYAEELNTYDTQIFITSNGERITRDSLNRFSTLRPVVFLCGSRDFVEGMQLLAHEAGIPNEDVRRELFTL